MPSQTSVMVRSARRARLEPRTISLRDQCRWLERAQRRPRVAGHRPWPPPVLPFGKQIGQLRHDLFGEELGVVLGEVLAYVAELEQHHQMADIEIGRDFLELRGDLVR